MSVGKVTRRVRAEHLGPERRRPQVLDVALQLASEAGARSVSMEAVAAKMGVTKPVVYSCFASREDMLTALLEREEQALFASVMAALPGAPDFREPRRVFIEGFRALLAAVEQHAESWALVFASEPDPAIADRYGQARKRVARRVAQLMAPALKMNGVKDIERKLPVLVELFVSIGDGAVKAHLRNRGLWSSQDLGEYVGEIAWAALKKA